MSAEGVVYSIQQTYIIKSVSNQENRILTCDQRIDIPTIEPLPNRFPSVYDESAITIVPCIEIADDFTDKVDFWGEFDLTFETNEGVTVLPIKIDTGADEPQLNPYRNFRYVLVLPRDATGVKSCRLIHKATGKEVQHNLTFGIMPPPYDYDNALHAVTADMLIEHEMLIEENTDNIAKIMFTSARGKATRAETLNVGKDGFSIIVGNPRFIRAKLRHDNTTPLQVDFYFSDNKENTIKTRVNIPAGDSVIFLDLITGQMCVTTTNSTNVTSVTYPMALLPTPGNSPAKWAWATTAQSNIDMEVQQWL